MVFEIQENSDVTFRLYDWDHVDAKTGKGTGPSGGSSACLRRLWGVCGRSGDAGDGDHDAVERERLFHCEQFWLSRLHGDSPFTVGPAGVPRVLVCIEGTGQVEHDGAQYAIRKATSFCCLRFSECVAFSREAQ